MILFGFIAFVGVLVINIALYYIGELTKRHIELFEYFGKVIEHPFTENEILQKKRKRIRDIFYLIGVSIQIYAVLQIIVAFFAFLFTIPS